MKTKKVSMMYLIFTVIFVSCLLLSNVAASKMFLIGPFVLTAGVLLFPITYIINDVLAEVYGYQKARMSIFLGFAMNVLMVVYFMITIQLTPPPFYTNQIAYATILGNTPRLLLASLAAYLVGSTLNAKVMVKMKAGKGDEGLFLRCILSTLLGEISDSILFVLIAFFGKMPMSAMVTMIITQAVVKTLYEFIIFPITHKVIRKVKDIEGVQ